MMRCPFKLASRLCLAFAAAVSAPIPIPCAQAEDLSWPLTIVASPFKAMHREKPKTGADDSIEQLASEIDWLEHHIDKYGSIVTKHPDVWGESRLMRHRYEYEEIMAAQLNKFEVRMNAALRRSDQSFLGMALSLQAATGDGNLPAADTVNTNLSVLSAMVPDPAATDATAVIQRTKPFAASEDAVPGFAFRNPELSLEPTIQLDQMSRYLNHLHELRRINEGDDIADSPGYSLNLVRIPVSVLPGKHTRKGYGAEVTVIAEPHLGEDLLPITFRNLVINDLVDMLAPSLTTVVNDPDFAENADAFIEIRRQYREEGRDLGIRTGPGVPGVGVEMQMFGGGAVPSPPLNPLDPTFESKAFDRSEWRSQIPAPETFNEAPRIAADAVQGVASTINDITIALPTSNSRRARLPLSTSQFVGAFGSNELIEIALEIRRRLSHHPINNGTIHYMDVRSFLNEELQASYEFLSGDNQIHLWNYCGHQLAMAVREHRVSTLANLRTCYFDQVLDDSGVYPEGPTATAVTQRMMPHEGVVSLPECNRSGAGAFVRRSEVTAALSWAILIESALLNERLVQDIREISTSKGCCLPGEQHYDFFGPHPTLDACMVFNEYVKCRWPIRVFALDPVSQDQNVADEYARRRELQVAIALAFASGEINAQAMMRYARRLEWDMATIALNKTAVGFSHGNDTFGWRFHPRFQTPPVRGQLATFSETLFGGPTSDADLRQRQLEPGMRECTAIVVMPSFVPYCTFDVRTNWFHLTHPKQTEISMKDMMVLSRSVTAMRNSAAQCAQCAHLYRDGEVHRLLRRVDQLDRELPLQSMQVQIPYENTAGGFEMFNHGITDLAPELLGWYGAPGINPSAPTTLYLIGDGVSVHGTHVMAGGAACPFKIISRQVMEVQIPAGIQVIQTASPGHPGQFDEVVDVHLATPYGVSSHLVIPVAKEGASLSASVGSMTWLPNQSLSMQVKYTVDGSGAASAAVSGYYAGTPGVLAFQIPDFAPVPAGAKLQLVLRDGTVNIHHADFTALAFDARSNTFYISGANLQTFVDAIDDPIGNYVKWLRADGDPKTSFPITVQAVMDPGGNRPLLPVLGHFTIQVDVD